MKRLALLLLALLVAFATPARADRLLIFGGGNDMVGSVTDPNTITGPLQIVKQTGADIVIDGGFSDTANWTEGTGWSLATGAAVHTGGTAGTLTPAVALAPTPGTTYEVTVTGTFPDTRSLSIAFGGVTGISAWATTRTQIVNITAGTNGTLTFTPTTAGTTLTIDNVSIKPLTDKITASAGPLLFEATLSDPSRNEAAMKLNYTVNKAAGNDTGLEINMTDTTSGGTSYPLRVNVNGATIFRVLSSGTTEVVSGNFNATASVVNGGSFTTAKATSGSAAPYDHTGTQITWGSIYKDSGTVGIMNGSDILNIFDASITNSDHTGSGNEVRGFNAGNITGDGQALESAIYIGTGWDRILKSASVEIGNGGMWMSPPATSVLTGSIDPVAGTTLTGVGTLFTQQTMPGDKLLISGETVTLVTIIDDTHATCTPATTDTANDASVDRYPVGLSITGADTSVGTDLRIYPAVKSGGLLFDFGVGTTSKGSLTSAGTLTLSGGVTAGNDITVGTMLTAGLTYLRLDTLNADTAGAPTATDCDASTEVGRSIVSTRYSSTAEYRLWVCVQTGASTFAWYRSDLTAP